MSEAPAPEQFPSVTVVGGGVMGGTIVSALRVAGWPPDRIVIAEKDAVRGDALHKGHGVAVIPQIPKAVRAADVVVIAVKPQDAAEAVAEIAGAIADGAMVLTVAAGLPSSFYEKILPEGTPVVRAMPNTPSIVAQGATAVAGGKHAEGRHIALVGAMLRATGVVVKVDEADLDAVTAVSGSGPAYFYAVVEALIDAGVELGLDRLMATQLAAQTFVGAARLLTETGETPQALRAKVSSPGGTTIAALDAMSKAGLPGVIAAGAKAAAARSREMAAELGGK